MQLHAGAGRFRRDRLRLQAQPFRAGDVDQDVLATGGEDRVVERLIARRLAHPAARKVFGHQRRQDADHHDVRAVGVGLCLRGVEAGPHLGLQFERGAAGQRPGRNVEFDVVGAQFGLVGRDRRSTPAPPGCSSRADTRRRRDCTRSPCRSAAGRTRNWTGRAWFRRRPGTVAPCAGTRGGARDCSRSASLLRPQRRCNSLDDGRARKSRRNRPRVRSNLSSVQR